MIVWSLGWEDPLEKGKATHSSILTWRIPWGHKELDRNEQLSLSLTFSTEVSLVTQGLAVSGVALHLPGLCTASRSRGPEAIPLPGEGVGWSPFRVSQVQSPSA